MLRDYFSMDRRAHPRRVLILMVCTIAFIAMLPVAEHIPRLVDIVHLIMVVSAISVAGVTRRSLVIGASLGIPAGVFGFLANHSDIGYVNSLSYLFNAALYIYMLVLMLRRIFLTQKVTKETIYLAITCYLMMGLTWTVVYIPLEIWAPGSFTFSADLPPKVFWVDLYYFSFVTLTTLGYGDVSPVAPLTRMLAIFEAMAGVLYLGILMARLIGAYEGDRTSQEVTKEIATERQRNAETRSIGKRRDD